MPPSLRFFRALESLKRSAANTSGVETAEQIQPSSLHQTRWLLRVLAGAGVGALLGQLAEGATPAEAALTQYTSGTTPDSFDRSVTANGDVVIAGGGAGAAVGNLQLAGALVRPNGQVLLDLTNTVQQTYLAGPTVSMPTTVGSWSRVGLHTWGEFTSANPQTTWAQLLSL